MKSIKIAKWCGRFVRCGYIWAESVMISWFSYRDGCCTDHTTTSITPWWPGSAFHYSWFCRIATCNFSMIECAITLTFVFPQMFLLLHCKISKTKTKEMISVLENVFTEWLERSHHDIHVIGGVLPSSWLFHMKITACKWNFSWKGDCLFPFSYFCDIERSLTGGTLCT